MKPGQSDNLIKYPYLVSINQPLTMLSILITAITRRRNNSNNNGYSNRAHESSNPYDPTKTRINRATRTLYPSTLNKSNPLLPLV